MQLSQLGSGQPVQLCKLWSNRQCMRAEAEVEVGEEVRRLGLIIAQKDPGEGLPMNDAADIEGFLVGFSSICFLEFFGMRLV